MEYVISKIKIKNIILANNYNIIESEISNKNELVRP